MLEDREILRQVWEGRVAACVCLASEDISTLGQPDPQYLMLPRISYFQIVLEKVSFWNWSMIIFNSTMPMLIILVQ